MIDFHTHIYPDRIASAAVRKLSQAGHFFPAGDGTEAWLKASMAPRDIELSLILPVATNPLAEKVRHLNDFAAQFDGSDGLLSFGGIHPDCPDWKAELSRIKALGLKGIKLHPIYQGVALNDIRMLRIMDEAASLGLIVVTHTGYDIGLPGHVLCTPEMAADVVKRIGKFRFVLAHMGGWMEWERSAEVLADTGCYVDTAVSLGTIRMQADTTPFEAAPGVFAEDHLDFMARDRFLQMVGVFGPDHILFGSDSPWDDPAREAALIRSWGLPKETEDRIFAENAKKLLGI